MRKTTKIEYKVINGYGCFFGNINYFDNLKDAWNCYKANKEEGDYGVIERVEVTRKLFSLKREERELNKVIEWGF